MKKFFQNKSNVVSLSTVFLVLLTLVAVTHYYLQYDTNAVRWVYAVGYFCMVIISVATLLYGIFNKKYHIKMLGLEFVIFSGLMFIFSVLNFKLHIAYYPRTLGMIVPLFLIPAYADKDIFKKPLISDIRYIIVAGALILAGVVLAFIDILSPEGILFKIYNGIVIGFNIFAIVLGAMNMKKKVNDMFSYSIAFYGFMGALIFTLRIFNHFNLSDKFLTIYSIGGALMMICALSAEPAIRKSKKIY